MNLEESIYQVLRQECGVTRALGPETRLVEDLGLDSVRLLTLAVELENRYQVVLGEDPDNPPRTIGELTTLLKARVSRD